MALVEVDLTYLGETDAAVKFKDAEDRVVWLPKSTIIMTREPTEGETIPIGLQEWKAEKEGLI